VQAFAEAPASERDTPDHARAQGRAALCRGVLAQGGTPQAPPPRFGSR